MFAWLQRSVPFVGSALFRGTWPLRKENFDHLRASDIQISEGENNEGWHWSLKLNHPDWGEALLVNSRTVAPPPPELIEWDATLNPDEIDEIKSCGTMVQLMMDSKKNNILRDRKNALHFLNAAIGEDGLAAMDHVAQKIWSRDALAIETGHSADLDVDGILTYHLVSMDREHAYWLHSHGLGEIGFYDFDILSPSEDLNRNAHDVLRSLAFRSLEGELKPGAVVSPFATGEVRCVAADEFMSRAAPEFAALREDASGDHREHRVVLCNARAGLFSSLLGSKPQPAMALSIPFDERNLIQFSSEATELMSIRAKASFGFFVKLVDEMSALARQLPGFETTPALKLGYKVDNAVDEHDREHMWFEFHGMSGEQIDATLLNAPFHIASMKEGQRGLHSQALLTEWCIFTPAGKISHSNSRPLRFIRKNLDRLREALVSVTSD
ncbi:MAG: DUF4026 domain-containing protein [Limisphaerales bacterium]